MPGFIACIVRCGAALINRAGAFWSHSSPLFHSCRTAGRLLERSQWHKTEQPMPHERGARWRWTPVIA
ncbi:MAG TPA: hypothetical protein VE756_11265 [Burkholderiales bacterium]|nr:hypothetical protein [Burkholderiales bacterium]